MGAVLRGEAIDDLKGLAVISPAWDDLAAANGHPQMTPAWTRGWLRHLAPAGTEPRVVVVREGERVVGVAPLYLDETSSRIDYRIANIEMSAGLSPLAIPGREQEVAAAIAGVLSEKAAPRPDLLAFEGVPVDSPWPQAMRAAWPGRSRPALRRYTTHPSPSIGMTEDGFEAWFANRSSHFRQHLRRARRKFEKAGGSSRRSEPETLAVDVRTFVRLHTARWESKPGTSNLVAFGDRLAPMLEEVGRELGPDRFRLRVLEVDGEAAAANIFLAAGGHALYLNCGWDERFAKLNPVMLALLDAVEESFARGDENIDLGLGGESYKLRFADGDDPVAWTVLMVPGRRLPITAARMAPTLARAALRDSAKRHLSGETLERLRAARKRLRSQ
jgi:CelD/BcsL family acetyltransferase involved in cellulose biosynthesis